MELRNADFVTFMQLRDCFYGGYSFPQFCIDNGISSPMVVSLYPEFLWEIYVQCRYDKRVNADFCFVQNKNATISLSVACVLDKIPLKNFSSDEINSHDKIIVLTLARMDFQSDKLIYIDQLLNKFISFTYAERPLLHYLNHHKNVKIIVTNNPYLKINQFSTDYERAICNGDIHNLRERLRENKGSSHIANRYDIFGYSNEEVLNLLEMSGAKTNLDGSTSLLDNDNPLINIKDGKRMTAWQPSNYKNTIYFMGTCSYFGIGAPFDKTIESCLQKRLNEGKYKYRVENASQFFAGRYQDIFYNLNNLPVKDGDIIFIFIQDLQPFHIPFINIRDVFDRPHNYGEVFSDVSHLNEHGYEILANIFYNILKDTSFFKYYPEIPKYEPTSHIYGVPNLLSMSSLQNKKFNFDIKLKQSLDEYKNFLKPYRVNIGCIVMNCNPFTLGHRYLIEYAAKKVGLLYVFVVEEDKSQFQFADRINLVKQGVKDISNVVVLPSGKFMISSLTFSGYFNKAELQNTIVDSKFDVELFAEEIAPSLGINIRFAGEEPNDTVTKQYNENMKEILPRHGIKFIEIPRKSFDGEVISAKRVRNLLKEKNFDEISHLVPESTLKYLKDKFDLLPPPPSD